MHLRTPRTLSPYPATEPSPWHNLGVELNHPRTAREAIASARQESGNERGLTGTGDAPLQSGDAFAFFDALVAQREAVYETAGIHGLGDSVWILAKLPGYIKVHRNDIVNKYLLLTSSGNGTSRVRVKLTPIRAVCNNSLTTTLQGAGDVCADDMHQAQRDPEQAVDALALSNSLFAQLDVIFNSMAARNITAGQLQAYVEAARRAKQLQEEQETEDLKPKEDEWGVPIVEVEDSSPQNPPQNEKRKRSSFRKSMILMVGTGRFELPTPRTPSECSTRLSHVPTQSSRLAGSRLLGSFLVYTREALRACAH